MKKKNIDNNIEIIILRYQLKHEIFDVILKN